MTPLLRRLVAARPAPAPADDRVRAAALAAALARINHDLRNALATAALASARRVPGAAAAVPEPALGRLLPRLVEAIERATALATAAAEFADGDAAAPARARFGVRALVDEIGRETDALMDARPDTRFTLANEVAADCVLDADRALVGGVLLQLAVNARQNGARAVRVSARREEGRILVSVGDDGPGLAPGAHDNLFTPFLGARRAGGSGLGLALARAVLRAHGGELRLAATGAAGTTFVLELPDPTQEDAPPGA